MEIENLVLKGPLSDEEYTRKTIAYLVKDYFKDPAQKAIYLIADKYFKKYNKCATLEVVEIEVNKLKSVNESLYKSINETLQRVTSAEISTSVDWLVDETESFCRDSALFNALQKAIEIVQGDEKRLTKTAIPDIMRDALGISFDSRLGHDYFESAEEQHDYYTNPHNGISFDIDILNDVTNGGPKRKTLNLIAGASHGGKSLGLCHLAASYQMAGYNVLYLTMEMSEEEVRKRIDANLLNVKMDDVASIPKAVYLKRIQEVHKRTTGRLKIKEYGTSSASASNFRYFVNELKIKQNFIPDIIIVDYLNIVASEIFRSKENLYGYMKSVAEELRSFAKETDTVVWSAVQIGREGMKSSDPKATDLSDSIGVFFTADLTWVLYASEEMVASGQIMINQEKSRFKDINYKKKFIIGIDRPKMRWYDVEQDHQLVADISAAIGDNETNSTKKSGAFKDFT